MRCESLVDEKNICYITNDHSSTSLDKVQELFINGHLIIHQLQEDYNCDLIKVYARLLNNNNYSLGIELIHPRKVRKKARNKMAKNGKKIAAILLKAIKEHIHIDEIHVSFIIEDFTFIIGPSKHLGKADWEEYFTYTNAEING